MKIKLFLLIIFLFVCTSEAYSGFVQIKASFPVGKIRKTEIINGYELRQWEVKDELVLFFYSPVGDLFQIERKKQNGVLIERTVFAPKEIAYETFFPHYVKRVLKRSPNLILTSYQSGKEQSTLLNESVFFETQACFADYDFNHQAHREEYNANRAVNNILKHGKKLIDFKTKEDGSFSMNTVVTGCKDFSQGGEKKMADLLQKSVDQGLRCIGQTLPGLEKEVLKSCKENANCKKQVSHRASRFRYEAVRLVEVFTHPRFDKFKIDCQKDSDFWFNLKESVVGGHVQARAYVCPEDPDDYPGMAINLNAFEKVLKNPKYEQAEKESVLESVLFHELMHLIGYISYPHSKEAVQKHAHHIDEQPDVPLLLEDCCFLQNKKACNVLLQKDHTMPSD